MRDFYIPLAQWTFVRQVSRQLSTKLADSGTLVSGMTFVQLTEFLKPMCVLQYVFAVGFVQGKPVRGCGSQKAMCFMNAQEQ